MQDIDFDELDRAVSSVLGNSTAKTVTTEAKEADAEPVAVSIETRQSQPVTPPAARRVSPGRFMDVVHPSSDMKTANPTQTTRPLEVPSTPKIETNSLPVEIVDIVKTDARPTTPSVAQSTAPSTFSWPEAQSDISDPTLESSDPIVEESDVLESPFLTNTKVEKRPLGAFSADEPQSTPFLDLTDALKEQADAEIAAQAAQQPKETKDTSQITAEDFDIEASEEELLSLESRDEVDNTEPQKLLEQPDSRPLLERDTPAVPNEQTRVPELVQVSTPAVSLGVASIPQQYTEQPASDDQPSGAIYDTESYHQPLTHPRKKNSGWLVIVWIVGLILFGAGIGAAMYFFVLPLL